MKKLFTLALLALFGLNASAQEVTIDFSGSEDVWGIGTTKLVETNSFTNNGITIKLTGTEGNGYRWYDSGNIILGKQGATLQLPAFNFDVQRIDIVGTSGASAQVKQNIFVGDDAVSTETTGAKDVTNSYVIDEGKRTAGTIYTLKVTSNHNTQITKILIYKAGSSSKQQAGLSWGKASATVTIGADENIFPILTNPNNLAVTYDSSNKECATISEDGAITLVAAGKTDISAEFAGNDEYEAQTVKYTLTVKAAPKAINVQEALAIINELEAGKTTDDEYIVTGFVVGTPDFQRKADETLYGNVNFTIANEEGGTDLLSVFRAKNFGNVNFTEETINKFAENDKVELFGKLQKYVKDEVITPQLTSGYLVSVTPAPIDVTIAPESGDISEALEVALAGAAAKSVTINLKAGVAYTITKSITSSGNVVFNGNDATINAALEDPFIVLNGTKEFAMKADGTPSDHYLINKVVVENVIINGLKNAFIKDNQKTLLENLDVTNCKIEMPAAGKNFIDFNGKGYVGLVKVDASTIWANGMNTGFFAQYGSRPKNVNGEWLQEFNVQNSTIVNIANGKNVCDLKQNGTAQNVYTLKNNIFVDCGKSGQVVVGFNKGQTSATPVWDVTGNYFEAGGECKNAAETEKAGQKDGEDIVKNSVAGTIAFTDAANGDFSGTFTLAEGATKPEALGDARWTITFAETPTGISTAKVAETQDAVIYNVAGQKVNASYKGLVIMNGRKFMNK